MSHINSAQSNLPAQGYLRLSQILKFIPVSRSTWWSWVKEGKAPAPHKLGPKITAWKAEDIHLLMDNFSTPGKIAA